MQREEQIQTAIQYYRSGQFHKAAEKCREILVLYPDNLDGLLLLSEIAYQHGDFDNSGKYLRSALEYHPGRADLHNNLGLILLESGKLEEAVKHFREATRIEPETADVHYNLGIALKEKGNLDEAVTSYRKALALNPANTDAYVNLGIALKVKGQLDEALACYRKALDLDQTNADAYINMSIVFRERGQLSEAIIACQRAIENSPASPYAFINMGNAILSQGKPKTAGECYRRALLIDPDLSLAYSNLLGSMNYCSSPGQNEVLSEHRRFAATFAEELTARSDAYANERSSGRRLRIGYVSPDFRQHSVRYFIEPVLASHNREEVEVFCYANVPAPDEVTGRLQGLADKWRDIAGLTDEEAAGLIREDGIDILIDLAGHTAGNRILVFARKPAPVQVSWIGYPATTGLSAIEYKIVDGYTDPPGMTEQYYTEKLLRLEGSFLCYGPERESPEVGQLPALERGHVTFGSFNNFAKVTPEVMRVWAAVLKRVPGSRLILKALSFSDTETCRYALGVFAGEGIEEGRIEFLGPRESIREHLAVYGRVDIGLDTFPYNGTTTTCEALWMGVPVITLAGRTHASRVGVSILSNAGLRECIASDPESYIAIACSLSCETGRLQSLRSGLRMAMQDSRLTDARRFTGSLEQCYREIWNIWGKSV